MKQLHVVILFKNSLFAAGIASWLAEAGFSNVHLLDATQPKVEEELHSQQSNIIIYDSSDLGVTENLSLFSILRDFPGLYILQVDYQKEEVQIFYSQQKFAHKMGEFISLMKNIPVPTD